MLTTLASTIVFCLGGCNTPTLPLPPPSDPDVSVLNGDAGVSGADYSVEPHADVIVFNNTSGVGRRTEASSRGAFVLRIPASAGDSLECWQRVGSQYSPSVSMVVPGL